MAFAKQERRRFSLVPGRGGASGGSRFKMPKLPPAVVMRFFVLALVGVIGAVWAIVHHYTTRLPPMLVPATPSAAPTYDVDAGELPVPEIERTP